MKDHDKYIYVEVALPKDNPAVDNLVAYSAKSGLPLRALVKSAAILAYSDEDEVAKPREVAKKPRKKKANNDGPVISDAARDAASSFLDDLGF